MILGLTGLAGAGKDSTADMLIERIGGWRKLAFADPIREMMKVLNPLFDVGTKHYALANGTAHYNDIVRALGYSGAKQLPAVRTFLQVLGTEAGRGVLGDDVWVQALVDRVLQTSGANDPQHIVVTDVRFANEVETIRAFGGFIVRVMRPGLMPVNEHISEHQNFQADWTLWARGLDELWADVQRFYPELLRAYAEQTERLIQGSGVPSDPRLAGGAVLQPGVVMEHVPTVPTEPDVPQPEQLTPEQETRYASLAEKHGL